LAKYRRDDNLNGMTRERYEQENEQIKGMNALDYAKLFTNLGDTPSSSDDEDDASADSSTSGIGSFNETDYTDTLDRVSPSSLELPSDPTQKVDRSISAANISNKTNFHESSEVFKNSTPSLSSSVVLRGHCCVRLPAPEFAPWIPAERYVSPELDGPWVPYQSTPAGLSHGDYPTDLAANSTGDSSSYASNDSYGLYNASPSPPFRPSQVSQKAHCVKRHDLDELSDSTLGESDSDYESGYLPAINQLKKRKEDSDDDYEDHSTKNSSRTLRTKQSTSGRTTSNSKTSSTSNMKKAPIAKSQKQAKNDGELESENEKASHKNRASIAKSQKRTRNDDDSEEDREPKSKKQKTSTGPKSLYNLSWNIPNGDLGTWPRDTYEALLLVLQKIRADEAAAGKTGIQGLRDIKLWNYASAELKQVGHNRSGSACKLFWGRYGRRESQFDERANPGMIL